MVGAPAADISLGARYPAPTRQFLGPAEPSLAAPGAPEPGAPSVPEPDAPTEPTRPDASEELPADEPLTQPADPPRPHPLRAYDVPPARSSQWRFTPEVTRWLPLVEAELAALRARRLAHP